MFDRDDLLKWTQINAARLRQCEDAMEMAELAKTCGFPIELACEVLAQGHVDIHDRSTARTREKHYVGGEVKLIETKNGLPDLQEQWFALYNMLEWGEYFEEVA